ncbi:alpha/beta-hydrolase [Lophiostoma macrostomum CBS 122681]|uniref:Alpha/beta-hydrolase n=1 Tax=Lophiostoma macrostomum CBS 122681 TaxID=1314788 RepID=A0A6A6TQ39_9PLEO|nr:alpha/beta-hydrolase [Lophiostoma macrostomum CBS 122681]
MDSTSWKAYGKIDPEFEAVLPHLPPAKSFADYGSAENLRTTIGEQMTQSIQAGIFKLVDWTGVVKQDIQIPTRDGQSIRAVRYAPESKEGGPLFVYFHGGGWTFGFPEAWESGFEVLTKELGFVVLSVDYRLAPEHIFPTAANDAWDSVQWAAQNPSTLGVNLAQGFIVGGTSAGANLAAIASHEATDTAISPPVTGQFLAFANLLHYDAVPEKYKPHFNSWEEFKDAMFLDQRGMKWFYEQYKIDPQSHLGSPLLWPSGHKSQPPTYFQAAGMDPARDETLIYEYILREESGVLTKLDVYGGLPHGATDFLPMLSKSKQALSDAGAGFEWLLSTKQKQSKV